LKSAKFIAVTIGISLIVIYLFSVLAFEFLGEYFDG